MPCSVKAMSACVSYRDRLLYLCHVSSLMREKISCSLPPKTRFYTQSNNYLNGMLPSLIPMANCSHVKARHWRFWLIRSLVRRDQEANAFTFKIINCLHQ